VSAHPIRTGLAAGLVALALVAVSPRPAGAVTLGTLTTYPVVAKLSMDMTVTVRWQGIKAGCFAPQENFDVVHTFSFDTHPTGRKSKVKPGKATLNSGPLVPPFFGATATLGAPKGAKQSGKTNGWDLEINYPAGCGTEPAKPPPPTIVAPRCIPIAERTSVSLEMATPEDKRDGVITIRRTPSKNPTAAEGANMGPSCYRTLHDVKFATERSVVAIFANMTFVQVPIPNLAGRLDLLAGPKGPAPYIFRISGDCSAAVAKPSIGPEPGFDRSVGQPHDAIGQAWNDTPGNNTCTISGTGRLDLTRTGDVKTTRIRA
jgi:hypothetical protein